MEHDEDDYWYDVPRWQPHPNPGMVFAAIVVGFGLACLTVWLIHAY